ncbi:hypothetical protein GOACH_11_01290 [Gordonia aichiensis NBRC 108223]|uniref:Uncharacterized protein n=1 Tax=Gordonia aichiensis NBRC 108223 TaxID=1220583 RepID=L7KMZ0_9ACTN|nr:hypothetical protein GOACH_11_01290 [Gordonia aichiensis NBRC 108223]
MRIITYSRTDLDRSVELIRGRLAIKDGEDRNPGDTYPPRLREYDCHHLVVTGHREDAEPGWLIAGGKLSQYFDRFGGLEKQIRTVAGHAWAEFEHSRRYKGAQYTKIGENDKETIDQLFGAASDCRRALDETFVAIDRILANPATTQVPTQLPEPSAKDDEKVGVGTGGAPVVETNLADFLGNRFPEDEEGSTAGVAFACELVRACGLHTIESLEVALEDQDSTEIRALMNADTKVTRVRRLDDELLARFGENYIEMTGDIGVVSTRAKQLAWRFDRLRGKTGYSMYSLEGDAFPADLQSVLLPAARAVREVARIVATNGSNRDLQIPEVLSYADDLPRPTRPKRVDLDNGDSLWIATNLGREYAEYLIDEILARSNGLDLAVWKDGNLVASGSRWD